jgi:hypothetical protein
LKLAKHRFFKFEQAQLVYSFKVPRNPALEKKDSAFVEESAALPAVDTLRGVCYDQCN